MKKFPVSRKLIIVSLITISALLATACQSRPTKVDSTTKDNSTNSATTTYQDKTEENTSSNADESTTVNGELSGESTGDITTEGSGDETTNIGDAETNNGSIDNSGDNSTEASTDDIVETTTQKPTETTTPKPTETTTPKPTEPPTPDFLEQIALTDAEKAEGYGLTYLIEFGNKKYYKYNMQKVGGKDLLTLIYVGLQCNDGTNYIPKNPETEYILDIGQRIVSTHIAGSSIGYFVYKPGQEGRVSMVWELPGMSLSHYYQGASMFVYTPWRCSSTEGPMVYDPNGEFIDKETYLYYMALYGNTPPDSFSNLDPDLIWTYDEISIEYDFVYDFYMFIETHLKGTEYENAFIEFGDTMISYGLYCGRYEVLKKGDIYNFFRELQKNNQ